MEFPSELIEEAVREISKLPGIGKKTALRLALHLLKQDESSTEQLSEALLKLRKETKYCNTCNIISHTTDCNCRTISRDVSLICIVEDTEDILLRISFKFAIVLSIRYLVLSVLKFKY